MTLVQTHLEKQLTGLAIRVVRSRGLVTVTVDGELDAGAVPQLTAAVRAACRLARHTVVVDALGLTFVDVAGRRALRSAQRDSDDGIKVMMITGLVVKRLDERLAHSERYEPAA